jgi:crossover junction endodeoxyribonuclease RuvC
MRVIGIDPSLRGTGFAVIEESQNTRRVLEYGVIKNLDRLAHSACLLAIHNVIHRVVAEHQPDCAAIENVIYVQSYRTAIALGSARGAAIVALAAESIPIFEYAPRRIKQAVVGRGAAGKNQVGFMIRALLGLTETPPPDAADAMAIALTHLQSAQSPARSAIRQAPV